MPSSDSIQSDLIFDLGMHTALDTKYYLDKGFRVVALEANPKLVDRARSLLIERIRKGRLDIEDKALWHGNESEISFFVNELKDDWSSAVEANADREGLGVEEISVRTTTLERLIQRHGIPYYIKCDLEGVDEIFVDQLVQLECIHCPPFVSAEVSGMAGMRMIGKLFAAGYDQMQIVNQALNPWTALPNPALEGLYVETRFNCHMSGLFGRELPADGWRPFEEISKNYLDFLDLKDRDPNLAHGWIDVHCMHSSQSTAVKR